MRLCYVFFVLAGLSFSLPAAQLHIEWQSPEKYTDIRPGNWGSKTKFQQHVTAKLSAHFEKLAEQLPKQQRLNIQVTNLDLAGDVRIGSFNEIRVIRSIDIPRIQFTYQLLDDKGNELVRDQVNLKDMGFDIRTNKYSHNSFKYEYQMLDNWFNQTFVNP
ncbi:DUF3016 domain-containing protein [Saccharobesus litoralis]|uniref:DUF3016 domain-containing protein n=1 Tax=Saccharobesus litoralis TaxID=2172099 RepID=A0A2S0VSB8_9ALTE|nr:DUF3016 domain-containing protein [Saccharobesus litoralis]AWB67108.1 DUF3016 domain-containing protein [Saccharobesus litoralis]